MFHDDDEDVLDLADNGTVELVSLEEAGLEEYFHTGQSLASFAKDYYEEESCDNACTSLY